MVGKQVLQLTITLFAYLAGASIYLLIAHHRLPVWKDLPRLLTTGLFSIGCVYAIQRFSHRKTYKRA